MRDVWSTAWDDAIAKITAWAPRALVQDGLSAFSNWKVTIPPMPVGRDRAYEGFPP